jgi:hypothetical protein
MGCVPATDQPQERLGSKRLQLNKGGGATPFLLRDLEDGDVNSIPTAPTKLIHSTAFVFAFDTNSPFDTN